MSQFDSAVDYSAMLSGPRRQHRAGRQHRKVTEAVNAYTQTIGIYPESLKRELRDQLPLFGAQRLTTLGYACNVSDRDAAGRDRADAPHVQVDRGRGVRS